MALRKIPVRRSSNRPNLFMGGDRELVMFAGLLAGVLVFSAATWYSASYGIFSWFAALALFRWMASKDPLMRQVYMRHLRYYQRCYLARSTPFRVNTQTQGKLYR